MTWWYIYAVVIKGKIDYIGKTTNTRARTKSHKVDRYRDHFLELEILARCRTDLSARREERRLIRKHKPPRNVQHNVRGSTWVDTYHLSPTGKKLPMRFLLREGMMHPDEARAVWFDQRHKSNALAIEHMLGWTVSKALRMFGSRRRGKK